MSTRKEVGEMIGNLKKAAIAAAFLTVAPVVPMLSGNGSDAQAHGYVSGSVVIGGPVAVLGFSYGNPFVFGHVHYAPAYCDAGPLFYYPQYHVYAHSYPRYRYHYYASPVVFYPGHRHATYGHHHHRHGFPGHHRRDGFTRVRGHKVRGHHVDD